MPLLEPLLVQPALQRHAHFSDVALEEVVAGNEDQLLGIGGIRHDLLQRLVGPEWSRSPLMKSLGLEQSRRNR